MRSTPCAADSRSTSLGQKQRHAREPQQVICLRAADPRHRHIAVADGLDLLHAMRRSELVELGDHRIEQRHGARGAELMREPREADEIGEQHRGFRHGVGDALARPLLQALGDRLRQNIGEQRIGLGARFVRYREGITHDQRDDAVVAAEEI